MPQVADRLVAGQSAPISPLPCYDMQSLDQSHNNRILLNVRYDVTEAQVRRCFSRFGDVSNVYLPKHTPNRNKGYATVTFASEAVPPVLRAPHDVADGISIKVWQAITHCLVLSHAVGP